MKKAILTQAQADALEERLNEYGESKSRILAILVGKGISFAGDHRCLNKLTLDEMDRALYIGYEVESNVDWIAKNRQVQINTLKAENERLRETLKEAKSLLNGDQLLYALYTINKALEVDQP